MKYRASNPIEDFSYAFCPEYNFLIVIIEASIQASSQRNDVLKFVSYEGGHAFFVSVFRAACLRRPIQEWKH